MTHPLAMVTPGRTVHRAPSQAPSSIVIGLPWSWPARCSCGPISWVLVISETCGASETRLPMVIRSKLSRKQPGPM